MTEDQRDRLEMMCEDRGKAWDFSPNDVAAIQAALEEINRLKPPEPVTPTCPECGGDATISWFPGGRTVAQCDECKLRGPHRPTEAEAVAAFVALKGARNL